MGSQAVSKEVCAVNTSSRMEEDEVGRSSTREVPLIALCSWKTPRDPMDTVYPTVCLILY